MVDAPFLGRAEPCGQVRIVHNFVVAQLGQLLHNLHKVGVLDVEPSAVADHNVGGPELLYLVYQEVLENLEDHIRLVHVHSVILVFGDEVVEILVERAQPKGEHKNVAV